MSENYILAFDQGTTSSRALIFDKDCNIVSHSQMHHRQIYPEAGWVSHDAREIYRNILTCGREAIGLAGIEPAQISSIGITNQRETIVAWDKQTGEPVCDAIVWQCRRTADICDKLVADGFAGAVRSKTGLIVDAYFSATKIKWILDNIPEATELLDKNRLLVGTIDCYLIWRLSGRHVTDYTNASRTMLFNINTLNWDTEILNYFSIPRDILPEVVSSSGVAGYAAKDAFGAELPIGGIAGDQHAALFGQTCFNDGDVKNTYGTGCFILKNIGCKPIISESRLLTTIAWHINGKITYALEGSIFNAGAAVEWMISEMKLASDVREINEICGRTADTGGVFVVPAFTGLGAPHWDMRARGTICGMSLSTNREHVVRAVMESIALQSRDVIDYMVNETGIKMTKLRVDGGVCNSDFLMQFQSDILNILVERPQNTETTALGAAFLAGLSVGFFSGIDELVAKRAVDNVFRPNISRETSDEKYGMWLKAVSRAKDWA